MNPGVKMNLVDVVAFRLREQVETIVACMALEAVKCAPLLHKIDPEDIPEGDAKRALYLIRDRIEDIKALPDDGQADYAVHLIFENGWGRNYTRWLSNLCVQDFEPIYFIAENAVNDIRALVVTRSTVDELQGYVTQLEEKYGADLA